MAPALSDGKRHSVAEICATLGISRATLYRTLGLPPDLFAGVPPRLFDGFRQRVIAEALHELRRHPISRRLSLLAASCRRRTEELTDTLAEIVQRQGEGKAGDNYLCRSLVAARRWRPSIRWRPVVHAGTSAGGASAGAGERC